MALKDIWRPRIDGVDDADSSAVNEIAAAVIELEEEVEDLPSGGTELTEEQLANIDKIPDIEQTAMGAESTARDAWNQANSAIQSASLAQIDANTAISNAEQAAINAHTAVNMAGGHALSIESLQSNKQDKVEIIPETTSLLGVDFSQMYNSEIRGTIPLTVLVIIFPTEAYEVDYIASVSFDSGETPTDVTYHINDDPAVPQLINWVGRDCTLDYHENDEGQLVPVSIFQPSAYTHYDIVFYFNGTQMIGLVNGFVPASGNVVSE